MIPLKAIQLAPQPLSDEWQGLRLKPALSDQFTHHPLRSRHISCTNGSLTP